MLYLKNEKLVTRIVAIIKGTEMNHFGLGSVIVIVITYILFTMALFTTGFTHDLLLEAGVFLVSVKLIIMAYNADVTSKDIHREPEEIKNFLRTTKTTHNKSINQTARTVATLPSVHWRGLVIPGISTFTNKLITYREI